ncbi:IMS domain-containing protein [Richelia intracellularis]|uniref:IMS domain-containing protein n=1 Tax=Richelia intracellularis TaxID=1164990 RepID=UPI0005C7D721
MHIPLDYYRILGLPLAASEEQLRQAYSDRIAQLPRREYSQVAIAARKQIIEEAYIVLFDPLKRREYEQEYLSHSNKQNNNNISGVVVEDCQTPKNVNSDNQKSGIEISAQQIAGALLILQELGEYELVLKLGHPYLVSQKDNANSNEVWDLLPDVSDIILTVSLACLELGREQWQQVNYENAAISLETGEELLVKKKLFPDLQTEIQSDLYKLRPYRILELLQQPIEKKSERKQGLKLLKTLIKERGGIDGTDNDHSGLNLDDFLLFIQQLRHFLTVAEQHKLFGEESKRPSSVAVYLTVYSLIARGFTQREPAFICQAKKMLLSLGVRQDIHLEQSLCSLLLGQTEEASRVLELSNEYEALAFIREKSYDSPDLLPGLCLYAEHWLETKLFPYFRDLVGCPASLKEYFANHQVQSYLEVLPVEEQEPLANSDKANYHHGKLQYPYTSYSQRIDYEQSPDISNEGIKQQSINSNISFSPSFSTSQKNPLTSNQELGVEQTSYYPSPNIAHRKQKLSNINYRGGRKRRRISRYRKNVIRLLLVVLILVTSLVFLCLLLSTTLGLLIGLFSPLPSLQGKQVNVQINKPLIEVSKLEGQYKLLETKLIETMARKVIEAWLYSKSVALGPNHDTNSLESILIGSALSRWQAIAQWDKNNGRYRQFEHQVKDIEIELNKNDENQMIVKASIREVANIYERGQRNYKKSYDDDLRVNYDLIKQDGKWRIQSMSLLFSTAS